MAGAHEGRRIGLVTSPKGKPDEWSERLWEAYKHYGEADVRYVQACNRFLASMLKHRLYETIELVHSLMHLFVIKREAPNPEKYMSGIPSIDLAEMRKANLHDELDVYRHWYSQHIKWPPKCLCEREQVAVGLERKWRTHPWFLTACVQVARRSLREDGFDHLEFYTSREKHEVGQPIPEGETLITRASRRMEAYLTSGAWRIDDVPMEDLEDVLGRGLSVPRDPDEDRRTYINRVKDQLDDRLVRAMQKATEIALHPRVPLQGRLLNPSNKHEEMLVRMMFGEDVASIAKAMEGALEVKRPRRTVRARTILIASHLGFVPPST